MNLKNLTNDEIIKLYKNKQITIADFVDSGICPTCFDKENNQVLYGNKDQIMLYEDELFECFLVGNPRCDGHAIISSKTHYKDMMEIDDELCSKLFILSKKVMCAIKKVYSSESVYLCTMCDGPMNHLHIQLIPRYKDEKRGSKNFVKPRKELIIDENKINELRMLLK